MNYTRFVELRRPIWLRFEATLDRARHRPAELGHEELEELALLYRQVLHDHSLAGDRFPGTGAARRLGRLAASGTHWLRRDRSRRRSGLWRFLTVSFPLSFRRHLPLIALAGGLFVLSSIFGLALAVVRPGAETALLPAGAIEGLKQGSLWTESLTTTIPAPISSSVIATNNMSVALTAWAGGALAGLGSLYVVLLNGLHLGAIVGVTLRYSMAGELMEFVAAHGPLELTLVVIASAAGLGMGRALVVAEDRPRREVLQEAALESLRLVLGCLPWFLLLSLVEAKISPQPAISPGVKALLGVALWLLFLAVAWNPALSDDEASQDG